MNLEEIRISYAVRCLRIKFHEDCLKNHGYRAKFFGWRSRQAVLLRFFLSRWHSSTAAKIPREMVHSFRRPNVSAESDIIARSATSDPRRWILYRLSHEPKEGRVAGFVSLRHCYPSGRSPCKVQSSLWSPISKKPKALPPAQHQTFDFRSQRRVDCFPQFELDLKCASEVQ